MIGTSYTTDDRRTLHVLADGTPINFMGFGEMPDEAADLILTPIFLSATELAAGTFRGRTGILPDAIDRLAEQHRTCQAFIRLCKNPPAT